MKNYLIIYCTGLLLASQGFAMASKNAEAARNSAAPQAEATTTDATEATMVPDDETATSANTTTPLPPLSEDESANEMLDRKMGRTRPIDHRRATRDMTASGTTLPKSKY